MVGTLFNLRSSMTKGFQSNFSHMFNNKSTCPLKNCTSRDEQSHLLSCPIILSKLSTADEEVVISVHYESIFGSLEEQRTVTLVLTRLMEVREELLEDTSGPHWTTVH